jgi:hypothetical protein
MTDTVSLASRWSVITSVITSVVTCDVAEGRPLGLSGREVRPRQRPRRGLSFHHGLAILRPAAWLSGRDGAFPAALR